MRPLFFRIVIGMIPSSQRHYLVSRIVRRAECSVNRASEALSVEVKMNADLCIGIASRNDTYEIATVELGKTSVVIKFPATRMGIEAIRGFLCCYADPVRLAVTGVAALSLALALGNGPGRETFIVSSAIANQATVLAHYAEHTV
jgi:hypothetical protein